MDLTIFIVGAGLLTGSLLLSTVIERLMRRFGITPAIPADRSGGFRDVFTRLDQWRRSRQTPDR
jgi:hypothetical protein